MGSTWLWKLTLLLGVWTYVTYAQDFTGQILSPGDPGFMEFQEEFNFTQAFTWNDASLPRSLRFTINGNRDAWLAISPVPDLTSRHYLVAINSLNGCGWPYNSHVLVRDYQCEDGAYATSNPIIQEGQDVEFVLTLENDGMSLSSNGGSTLSLDFDDDEPICSCCYIGVYSSFAAPITWSFPDADDLVPVINLVGKDSIQSDTTDGVAVSDRAIDGNENTDTDDDSCAITTDASEDGVGPYWRVDLGDEFRVDQVVLFDAFDCPTCCPDATWATFGQYCYKAFTTAGTHDGVACATGDLVSIHSQAELDFVSAFTAAAPLWIGLSDAADEGTFVWDDGSDFDFTAWDEFRPDTTGINVNDCVYLTTSGLWYDTECAGTTMYGYICKTRQDPVLDGLEVYVGSCDHTGTVDYNGDTPLITDNNQCGADVTTAMAEELYGAVTIKCDPPRYGRYIYVYHPETLFPDTLALCEVQAFGKAVDCPNCCPVTWSTFDQSCYKVFSAADIYDNIESSCPAGSDLVSIHSQAELEFLAVQVSCPDCCPATWLTFQQSCYKAFPATGTYDVIESSCPAGSDLVIINSQEELDFVVQAVNAGASELWIGLNDKGIEGTFVWEDGSALGAFRPWATGLPDAIVGNANDCVYLGADGLWYDTDCTGSTYGYICKQPRVAEGASELWIGLNDKSGTLQWEDGSALDFTAWAATSPHAPGNNCAYLRSDGVWYDTDCTTTPTYGYICKQPRDLYRRNVPLLRFPMEEITVFENVISVPVEIALYWEGLGTIVPPSSPNSFPTCYRFDVTTIAGSAVTGNDFMEVMETFSHTPNQPATFEACDDGRAECYEINIPITDDFVSENIENFTVQFLNVIGLDVAQLSYNPYQINIQDDDGCFELVRNVYTVIEPSSSPLIHKWINITVVFRALEGELPTTAAGSIRLSTLPIDATAAADYEVYTNHLVEFGPGVRSVNVPVGITDDRVTELNETFRVVLSGPSGNFQLCDTITEAVVTIVDNDHTCSISRPSFSALESQGTLEVTVTCEKLLEDGTSIGLSAQGITALAGSDYQLRNTWVIFDGTTLTGTFIIDIFDDAILEDAETFRLHLLNGDGVIIGDSNEATVTLIDNDASLSLEFPSYSFSEGGDTQTMTVVVERDGYRQQASSVWIRSRIEDTDNAIPADASDFTAINQEVNFEPGDVEKQVQINLIDDSIREALIESFLVELYNPTNGVIVDPDTAEIFIYDDDASEEEQRFFYLDNDKYEVLESEGDVQVTVLRTDAQYAGSVILSTGYFSTPGDARASEDYIQLNEKLEFAPGETSKLATIQIIGDDNVIEGPKQFHVDLFFPLGGKIRTPESAIICIIDDDVKLSFKDTRYATLEEDGVLNIPVRREGFMGPISVDAIVSLDNPGSAEEGVDYYAPATIIFGQDESEAFLQVTIVDDDIDEATTESFNLELVAPSNGQLEDPSKIQGVIFDNDEKDETDGSGYSLGSTAIVFIGLGAGFGLLALVALVAGVCICMRIANANRLRRSRQYLAPAPRPYELTPAVAPPYEQRGRPYYLR
ncbi:uncharacterized protein [Amphiura filiformis]|uniref:uncharacterized protein isoform X2 n=1 Tax=Amphiura filiformis TaxID=82378 RepID=UPI003B20D135